jgi:hypothetical protein
MANLINEVPNLTRDSLRLIAEIKRVNGHAQSPSCDVQGLIVDYPNLKVEVKSLIIEAKRVNCITSNLII